MLIAGHWLIAFLPVYRKALLHISFIGGYSLMTFAVATMVILTHAGFAKRLKESLWSLRIVAIGVPLSLGFRVASEFVPSLYFALLGIGSALWMGTALIWLVSMLPYLTKALAPQEFEQSHNAMKHEILHTSEGSVC
ncbi:MAG: hypothetical protein A3G87_00715 [Omnitrophica bacterium RIFCSPLOWO2_12_FULL_50_11]|nr:MAG: hypothetical protein A3G87_00715 [Omnitrophica bacterium RIFCSPLOWO2_12_FULL_50_11]